MLHSQYFPLHDVILKLDVMKKYLFELEVKIEIKLNINDCIIELDTSFKAKLNSNHMYYKTIMFCVTNNYA